MYTKDVEQIGKSLLAELPDDWAAAPTDKRAQPLRSLVANDIAVRKRKPSRKARGLSSANG
ncbi:MAG: hypothetical protein IPP40_18185 [bacterium]|nr:hypothetical protein [bacterium]